MCYPGFISPLSQLYLAVISALSCGYLSSISALSQPYLSLISALSQPYLTVISRLSQPYLSFTSALSQPSLSLISTALKQGLAIANGIFAFERRSLPTCDSNPKFKYRATGPDLGVNTGSKEIEHASRRAGVSGAFGVPVAIPLRPDPPRPAPATAARARVPKRLKGIPHTACASRTGDQ